jgi:EAL and modified HD-GYP domain-containing signal transduction protein
LRTFWIDLDPLPIALDRRPIVLDRPLPNRSLATMQAFIARQPIFDRRLAVRAYELLFRSGSDELFPTIDPNYASSKVIADSMLLPQFDAVSGGKTVFINVTRDLLVEETVSLLPASSTVLEILETIEPDADVLRACRRLRSMGYRLALDDYKGEPGRDPFFDVVDIVKVEVLDMREKERAAIAARLRARSITVLAEKVETRKMYGELVDVGYELFQGYFFARPTIVSGRDIPAMQRSCLQILREINRPHMDFAGVRGIVERELALSYKLLRYVNSAFFTRGGTVSSIQHALLLLGENETKRWASIVALAAMKGEEPTELLDLALLRGRLCELLAPAAQLETRATDLFLVGLFSMLDAILEYPVDRILEEIPIADDAKAALLGEPGTMRDVLNLSVAYSMGDWPVVSESAAALSIPEEWLPGFYESALGWCRFGLSHADLSRAA